MLDNRKGFTLIELVIIIVILGILAAVAVPKYYDMTTDARTAAVKGGLGAVKSAWAIEIAKNKGTNPSVTDLAARVDGGTAAAAYVTIADIYKNSTTLYHYNTYTDAACTAATTAVADLVACVACENANCALTP